MPTYNYMCYSCNEKFTVFQKMSDKPITNCIVCKNDKVERLISKGSGLIFKGTGFYLTDYKNKKTTKKEE
tara:strand:- start:2362 stop:2571 length:210 start_codon:yes stop_codon:yes gene_type:complete